MGPLFSAGVAIFLLAFGVMLAYVVARFFLGVRAAFGASVVFVVAGAVGIGVTGVLVGLLIGFGGTLTESWQVFAYLSSLGLGGFLMGVLAVRYYLARQRSNYLARSDALTRAAGFKR